MKRAVLANNHPNSSSVHVTRVEHYSWKKVLNDIRNNAVWLCAPLTLLGLHTVGSTVIQLDEHGASTLVTTLISIIVAMLTLVIALRYSEAKETLQHGQWQSREHHRPYTKKVHVIYKNGSVKWSQKTKNLNWSRHTNNPITAFLDATNP